MNSLLKNNWDYKNPLNIQNLSNMKRIASLLMVMFTLQTFAQTKGDTLAIEKAIQDYVEGWTTGNILRIQNSVFPELAKRKVASAGNFVYAQDMSCSLLCASAMNNANGVKMPDLTPGKELELKVRILDIDGTNASAKSWNVKYGFFDYIHLSKAGGRWMIINVLWDMNSK